MNSIKQIFDGQAADGESEEFTLGPSDNGDVPFVMYVTGDLGGGTLTLNAKAPDDTFVPVADLEIAEIGLYTLQVPALIGKLELSGSTGAAVNVWVGSARAFHVSVRKQIGAGIND